MHRGTSSYRDELRRLKSWCREGELNPQGPKPGGFSVHSFPLTRIRLASVADALQEQAPSTTMSE